MRRRIAAGISILTLTRCSRYEPAKEMTRPQEEAAWPEGAEVQFGQETQEAEAVDSEVITIPSYPPRNPVRVKGIYASVYMAGTGDTMDKVTEEIDRTEPDVVVIDVKDDQGRITYAMDSPTVNEIGVCQVFIRDIPTLMTKLKEHGIYTIVRVVASKDPYLAEQKPEWSLHVADDRIYRDNKGLTWVSPYKKEIWDYLVEAGKRTGEVGFDEIQFDYIRFAVDRTMNDAVFGNEDTQGRNRIQAITELISYVHDELAKEGFFILTDVFGAIMCSEEDAATAGQEYEDMAEYPGCICPIIYPSHYGPGNLEIEYPDTQSYSTILNALNGSRELLAASAKDDTPQAVVRPRLQDFTTSYLEHYIRYGDEQVRQQIQAVYDAGYDQWILWDAGVSYHYDGLLTPEEAAKEGEWIARPRAVAETGGGTADNTSAESTPAENVPVEHTPVDNIPPASIAW